MLNAKDLSTLRGLFAKMDRSDLNRVAQLHKATSSALQSSIAASFLVREKVTFTGKRGEVVVGTIEKVNRKTIKVRQSSNSMLWTVSPSLLRKA